MMLQETHTLIIRLHTYVCAHLFLSVKQGKKGKNDCKALLFKGGVSWNKNSISFSVSFSINQYVFHFVHESLCPNQRVVALAALLSLSLCLSRHQSSASKMHILEIASPPKPCTTILGPVAQGSGIYLDTIPWGSTRCGALAVVWQSRL